MVLFGAMERPYMKPGQLSLGHGRCVSPASVTCACCKEVPFTALLCLKLKLGTLSLSVDALKDTAFSPANWRGNIENSLKVTSC